MKFAGGLADLRGRRPRLERSPPRTWPILRPVTSTGELTVSKMTFAALSLIGAIPGGYLSIRLVMAMVYHFRDMVGMMKVVVCLILLLSAVVTVIPIGVLIFIKEERKPKARDEESGAEEVADDDVEELAATDDDAGRRSVVVEEMGTKVDMSDLSDDLVEAEEDPRPMGKKKRK
jgi:hypothetical protein